MPDVVETKVATAIQNIPPPARAQAVTKLPYQQFLADVVKIFDQPWYVLLLHVCCQIGLVLVPYVDVAFGLEFRSASYLFAVVLITAVICVFISYERHVAHLDKHGRIPLDSEGYPLYQSDASLIRYITWWYYCYACAPAFLPQAFIAHGYVRYGQIAQTDDCRVDFSVMAVCAGMMISDFVLPYCRPKGLVLYHHIVVIALSFLAMICFDHVSPMEAFLLPLLEIGSQSYNIYIIWNFKEYYMLVMTFSGLVHLSGMFVEIYFASQTKTWVNWVIISLTIVLTFFRTKTMVEECMEDGQGAKSAFEQIMSEDSSSPPKEGKQD